MNIKKIADKTFGWMPEYMILDDAWKERGINGKSKKNSRNII